MTRTRADHGLDFALSGTGCPPQCSCGPLHRPWASPNRRPALPVPEPATVGSTSFSSKHHPIGKWARHGPAARRPALEKDLEREMRPERRCCLLQLEHHRPRRTLRAPRRAASLAPQLGPHHLQALRGWERGEEGASKHAPACAQRNLEHFLRLNFFQLVRERRCLLDCSHSPAYLDVPRPVPASSYRAHAARYAPHRRPSIGSRAALPECSAAISVSGCSDAPRPVPASSHQAHLAGSAPSQWGSLGSTATSEDSIRLSS